MPGADGKPLEGEPGFQRSDDKGKDALVETQEKLAEAEKQLQQARTWKERSEILDEMLADPELLEFLEGKRGGGKGKDGKDESKFRTGLEDLDDKDLVIKQLDAKIAELTKDIKGMKDIYQKDQEIVWREKIDSEILSMQSDKTNFPFFKECRDEMATLLETGQVSTLKQAYKIAAFDRAAAHGRANKKPGWREGQEEDKDNKPLPEKKPGEKISVREALNRAADYVGFVDSGERD